MSNNVRIWSKADKKSEAAWLEFLLTLIGCQVWKGNLSSNPYIFQKRTPEYMNQPYCEAAEIYRGIPGQQEKAIQLLEKVDENDAGSYQGLYKLGLLYEAKGERNLIWYKRAEQEYRQVIKILRSVKKRTEHRRNSNIIIKQNTEK